MQRSFAAGEIGPTLYGGAEPQRYQVALSTCRNFIIMRGGGAANRTGSRFIAEVKDSTTRTYLSKFVYSVTDSYCIEAGTGYFRFYRLGGQVTSGAVAAWSNVQFYVPGDTAKQAGVNYYCILANNNQVPPNATYWYPMPGAIMEIPTPYAAADIPLLKYVQSGDIVTLTHPSYAVYELKRYILRWSLTAVSTAPALLPPAGPAAAAGAAGSLVASYQVTAVLDQTYEESVGSVVAVAAVAGVSAWSSLTNYVLGDVVVSVAINYICILANINELPPNATYWTVLPGTATPTATAPNVVTWSAVTGAVEYNAYLDQDQNGLFGYIGTTPNLTFNDIGFLPDASVTPPIARVLFAAVGDYPGAPGFYQQRRLFGGSINNPSTVYASRSGAFSNYTISSPLQDDDAVTFGIASRQANEVRHFIDIEQLIMLTSAGEFAVFGDANGVLSPSGINAKQQTYFGAAHIQPVIIGKTIVYLQARGSIIRDLRLDVAASGNGQNSYDGRDLTIYAPHLFEGRQILRLDFAQTPQSIVWCVRDDGTLLGLTYLPEQEVWGWHHHDTQGFYEDVCCIPEATAPSAPWAVYQNIQEDAVYVIVNRTIGGVTKRYVERFASRVFTDYRLDAYFLDAMLTYNGLNVLATTATLTTGGGWTPADLITVTLNAGFFTAPMVGDGVTIWIPATATVPGTTIRITITGYSSATVVTGRPTANVPAGLQGVATTNWSLAVHHVTGLNHLIGQTVNACANGVPIIGLVVDGSGGIELGGLYDVVHAGLPIVSEIETLDLDSPQKDIRDLAKLVTNASLIVEQSRGFLIGPDSTHLFPFVPAAGDVLGTDVFSSTGGAVRTETVESPVSATWNKAGRIHIRQTDPLPLAILGIIVNGPVGG